MNQEKLKSLINYNSSSGICTWIISGENVGWKDSEGYIQTKIEGHTYRLHRLIWLYETGKFPLNQIDHENHIRDDNRFSNLREVTQKENSKNRSKDRRNTSGRNGVTFDKKSNKWRARLILDGKIYSLGFFDSIDDAKNARDIADKDFLFHENHGASKI